MRRSVTGTVTVTVTFRFAVHACRTRGTLPRSFAIASGFARSPPAGTAFGLVTLRIRALQSARKRSTMAQIFPRWTNAIPLYGTVFGAVATVFLVFSVYFWMSPKHTDVGYQPVQPIPYSHALHAGDMAIDCRYCHYNVERSANAGVPPTQVCMNCHKTAKKGSPLLGALYESWEKGTPIHWLRIHKVGDYVYFNHSAHVGVGVGENRAAIGCETCHGRIDTMERVIQREPLSMSWCLDCHNDPAQHLRPVEDLTRMGWEAPLGWGDKARRIAATLNPPGRSTGAWVENPDGTHSTHATTGCTGCHR